MTTYGYARVSTVEQAEGTSLREQERKIRAIAQFRGTALDSMFVDAGVSGSLALEDRPQGAALVAKLRAGDTLICAKLDRAFRDAADALTKVKAWKALRIKLILTDIGTDPVTENGVSKLFFTILAGFAEWERERILERVNDGRRAKRAQGGFTGGAAPFGYEVVGKGREAVLVPKRGEHEALDTIRRSAEAGMTLRKIAEVIWLKHQIHVSLPTISRIRREFQDERSDEVPRQAGCGLAPHVHG